LDAGKGEDIVMDFGDFGGEGRKKDLISLARFL